MAYEKTAAYDLSLFDTSAEETIKVKKKKLKNKNNVVKLPEEEIHKIRYRRHNPFKIFVGSVGVCAITAVVIAIIIGQVQLTELNQQISTAQKELANQQSVYTQTQMAVQSSLSTSEIQKYAEQQLGMTKASNAQKEFVELSSGDKAEITREVNDDIFSRIASAISDLWS